MCRSAQRGDRILLGAYILNDDVIHVVFLDLRGEVDVNLNAVLRILFFDGLQQRMEPFCTAKVTDDPGEVNLPGQWYKALIELREGA